MFSYKYLITSWSYIDVNLSIYINLLYISIFTHEIGELRALIIIISHDLESDYDGTYPNPTLVGKPNSKRDRKYKKI